MFCSHKLLIKASIDWVKDDETIDNTQKENFFSCARAVNGNTVLFINIASLLKSDTIGLHSRCFSYVDCQRLPLWYKKGSVIEFDNALLLIFLLLSLWNRLEVTWEFFFFGPVIWCYKVFNFSLYISSYNFNNTSIFTTINDKENRSRKYSHTV